MFHCLPKLGTLGPLLIADMLLNIQEKTHIFKEYHFYTSRALGTQTFRKCWKGRVSKSHDGQCWKCCKWRGQQTKIVFGGVQTMVVTMVWKKNENSTPWNLNKIFQLLNNFK